MVAAAADHRAEARTLPHSTGRTVASSPRLPPRGCDSLSPSHSSTISVSVASSSTMIEFSPAPPSSGSFKTVRSLLTLREKTAEGAEEEQDELDAGPRQTVLTSRGMRPSTPSASRGKGGPPQSACVGMPRRVRGDSLSPLEAEEEMSVPTEEPNRMIPPTFLVPSQFAQQQQHGDGEERQSPVRAAQQVFSHEDLRTRILDFALSVPARPVRLRVYNLSREWGWVNRLKGLRQHLLEGGGAYHVSVEVDGVEWHYGAEKDGEFASCGITAWDPDELDFYGAVDHVVELGETRVPRWRIVKILDRMYDNDGFHTHGYLLYSRNCVHFVDTFLSRLAEADTGVQRMPTRYLRAHELARAVHNWLSGGKLDRLPEVTPKDPLAVQAALPRHTLDRCKLYDPRPKGAVLRLRGEEFFFPDQLVPCLSASALFHK
uniref:PPPDE domain-containing protein n=2 Tax=Chromera velia CCMP2878 TaxID=1169474 RepID=A0A0K6S694_9ALVE|eukprot:Cvel_3262.t2-p1 / transcript=Cvel_3262.t2 / gene=Cvel_3262 / organism=Chromera_velia_CCMP2878 / gene_product=hypothetical protein / transcript_product=hypothetical protein / location=Cvel_scaffold128:39016-40305(+) / protein_length=430 / sequence_SO=supercontig / SO=protein_coding / is_pseudo=false